MFRAIANRFRPPLKLVSQRRTQPRTAQSITKIFESSKVTSHSFMSLCVLGVLCERTPESEGIYGNAHHLRGHHHLRIGPRHTIADVPHRDSIHSAQSAWHH